MFLMRHYLLVLNYTYTQPENWLKNNTLLLSRVDYCVRIDSDRCIALPLPNAIILIIFILYNARQTHNVNGTVYKTNM